MSKTLVVVESPTKAKTIKRYLGKDFEVEATMGHIKDLPKTTLGVDIRGEFRPAYSIKPEKKDVVRRLKTAAEKIEHIFLASDPDREGEAIAFHVAEELASPGVDVSRIIFHEITKKAIEEAIASPKPLDRSLYDAQMARRSMDRIVGYTMSPLLWRKVKKGLSGGRVQSVAVRLICERQDEIEAFVPKEYWTIEIKLKTAAGDVITAKVVDPKDIPNEAAANRLTEKIRKAGSALIADYKKKSRARNPLPPFITSTLQQEASRRLRFSSKKTMLIAQQLYEGVAIGKSHEMTGLITYMRTDSPVVSKEALGNVREYIPSVFGKEYLPEKPVLYKAKKSAQEAHEAIRPTGLENTPEAVKPFLNRDQFALYDLIFKRFVASQMKSAMFEQTTIDFTSGGVGLRASGSVLKFDGFLRVYKIQEDEDEGALPDNLKKGDRLDVETVEPSQHFTQPPARYNEASLIKELEEKGIGRPSTYAPIISTIQDRGYVIIESGAFVPTELGRDVNRLLVKHYPNILDIGFTAKMEDEFDDVEEGKENYLKAMEKFYSIYNGEHEKAVREMESIKTGHRPSGVKCEVCGKNMLIKLGRNGYFLGCSGYPSCTNTKEYSRDTSGQIVSRETQPDETTEETCEKCGSFMIMKKGRFGVFLACSDYPKCKNTKPIKKDEITDKKCEKCGSSMILKRGRFGPFLACSAYPGCKNIAPVTLGLKCPVSGCSGEITQRKAKNGETFYVCTNRECKFMCWTKPVEKKCKSCGAMFLIRKGKQLICPNPECEHKEAGE
jgi:DNA topoisomerase-1